MRYGRRSWRLQRKEERRNSVQAAKLRRRSAGQSRDGRPNPTHLNVQNYFRNLIDLVPSPIFIKNRELLYTDCNQAFCQIIGLGRDEIIGRSVYEISPRAKAEAYHRADRELLDEGNRQIYEETVVDVAGHEHAILFIKSVIRNRRGMADGIIGIMVDLSEQREIERNLRQLENQVKRSEKFESLRVLAGGIAHDFNNLLVGVMGNVGLAMSDLPVDSPAAESIREIESAAHRAADLARQMLAFSGHGQFVIRRIEIGRYLQSIRPALEAAGGLRGEVTITIEPGDMAVDADAGQLEQVVLHLVRNAAEAAGDVDTLIGVRIFRCRCGEGCLKEMFLGDRMEAGEFVGIEVSDQGHGIPADQVERVFDPFYSTKSSGRGLGLPTVLGVVRGLGGGLRIDSSPDEGTTVRVLLPASPAEDTIPADWGIDDIETEPADGQVLVVDDEMLIREVVRKTLERAGYRVLSAKDGMEAVEVFADRFDEIDLVLLDMTMPLMDGREALARLREIKPNVRVLMSSGYHQREAISTFKREGAMGFLQKPYSVGELLSQIQRYLKR
jgi:two-component system, cell cycle sensor histidine kinase and response regulator CckA